jgi:hypothetical protein
MGAEPWSYFVPFREDIEAALDDLKEREFTAGRYRVLDPDDPPATIAEAVEQADADGTGTILDINGVADSPLEIGAEVPAFGMVSPLSGDQLIALYGTERPTRAQVEKNMDFYEWIDRGFGIYIVVYDGDRPSELFFAGYSFD